MNSPESIIFSKIWAAIWYLPLSNRSGPTSEDPGVKDWVYRVVIRTALGLFRVLGFRFTIEGEEHMPDVGGAVVVSNHVSYFDFMFVGLAARRPPRHPTPAATTGPTTTGPPGSY